MLAIGKVHYDGPYFAKLNDDQCKSRKCTRNMDFCWFSGFEKISDIVDGKNVDVLIIPVDTVLVSEKKSFATDKSLKLVHVDDINMLNDIDNINEYDGYYFITGNKCSTDEYYDNVNLWLKSIS